MTNAQAKPMRTILKWLEDCPHETFFSSMAGNIVHIKVSLEKPKEEKDTTNE